MNYSNNNFSYFQDDIYQAFPNIKDKMVIDFVNGLDVAKNINFKSKNSQSFVKRNLDLLSGTSKLRQDEVNDHFISGLEACRSYFLEMSAHVQLHSNAIIQLDSSLQNTRNDVAEIADFVIDFRNEVKTQVNDFTHQVAELYSYNRAMAHMENILSRWAADRLINLSPMGQCFSVLDSLRWGDFGSYMQSDVNLYDKHRLFDTLEHNIIKIQKDILQVDAFTDLPKSKWITLPQDNSLSQTLSEVMRYQGDDSCQNPSSYPMVFTATQISALNKEEQEQYSSLTVRRIDIDRVSKRMAREVFGELA